MDAMLTERLKVISYERRDDCVQIVLRAFPVCRMAKCLEFQYYTLITAHLYTFGDSLLFYFLQPFEGFQLDKSLLGLLMEICHLLD